MTTKDPAFDGTFFVAVKTTGIFCRPVCRAKTPRPENVEFFRTATDAQRAGYRACKLCKPLDPPQPPRLVRQLIELAEQSNRRLTERDLRNNGIEPTTARRQFRAAFNTTFTALAAATKRRLEPGNSDDSKWSQHDDRATHRRL